MNAGNQRTLIWMGVALAVVYSLGYAVLIGFFPPPSPTLGTDAVAALYREHNMQLRIGVVLCLIAGAFNLPWSVAISAQMARYEKGVPVWSITQALAGTLGALLFFAPPLIWGVAAFSADRDPALTLLMHELGFLTLVTPISVFPLQAIPIAIICFTRKTDEKTSAFPRWMGYFSAWMAISAEPGVFAMLTKTGPFAWNGLFAFYVPLGVFGIYISTLFYLMLRAARYEERRA